MSLKVQGRSAGLLLHTPGPEARLPESGIGSSVRSLHKDIFLPCFSHISPARVYLPFSVGLYLKFRGSFPVWKKTAGIWAPSVIREIAAKPCSESEQTPGRQWGSLGWVGAGPERGLWVQVLRVLGRGFAAAPPKGSKVSERSAVATHTCPPFLAVTPGLCLGVSAPSLHPVASLAHRGLLGCVNAAGAPHWPWKKRSFALLPPLGVWAFSGNADC